MIELWCKIINNVYYIKIYLLIPYIPHQISYNTQNNCKFSTKNGEILFFIKLNSQKLHQFRRL